MVRFALFMVPEIKNAWACRVLPSGSLEASGLSRVRFCDPDPFQGYSQIRVPSELTESTYRPLRRAPLARLQLPQITPQRPVLSRLIELLHAEQ